MRRIWQHLRASRWIRDVTVLATVIGAVAAIGGLWAQAWTAYYDGRVSQDQLQQSQENSALEKRRQASQVTFWVESPLYSHPGKIHLVNRSPDAVSSVVLTLRTDEVDKDPRIATGSVSYVLIEPNLRPCAEIIYSEAELELAPYKEVPPELQQAEPSYLTVLGWDIDRMYFVDRNGKSWSRSVTALSQSDLPQVKGKQIAGVIHFLHAPQVKRADLCGSDSE